MKMGKWRRLVTIWLSLLVTMTVVSVFTSWVAADSPKTSTSVSQPNGTPPQGGHPLEYQGDPPSTPVGPSQTWTGSDGKLQAAPQTVPAQGGVWTLTWTALYGLAWAAVRRKKQVQVPVYKTETYTEEVQTTRTVTRQVQEGFKMGRVKTLAGYKTEYEQQQTGWREWTENVVTGYRTWKEKVATGVRHWVELVQQGTKTVMQKVQTGFRTIMERVLVRNETKTRQVQVGTRTVTRSVPVQKQVQEQYVSSYRQVWDPVKKRLVSQPVYGTRYSTVTVYEQQTVTEPVYRTETYTEPVYENRTRQEPVYADVPTQVPNMVPVEHTEPVYTEVEHKEPIVQEVHHKDPVYEQVAKQVPVYETHMGAVPVYRTETVEEPVTETRTLTRQVQVGVRTEEQEVVENVQQEVFQGWSPSWKFTPSGGTGTANLDSQINAKSEELRQARELLARLPKEDQAGYQAVVAGLEAALADLYSQKNGSEVSVKAPALPPAAAKPSAPVLQVVQPKPDGSAAGLAARLDALNQEIDAASRDLRDARATLVRLPQADRTAYETQVVKPLETKLNGLYEQRNALTPDSVRAVQEAKVAQFGALARQGEALSDKIQLDASLSSIMALAGQAGEAASEDVINDYIAFQGALQDYWRYLLDPSNVSQSVHDQAILTMRNISSKYGTAFPGQDEWGLHQQNKVQLSARFRDLVSKLWLDKANGKTPDPGEQCKLDLWRSWVSDGDRAWEQKVGDLNQKVINLKKQRWSVLENLTGPVSDSAAADIRRQLDQISTDVAAQRRAGATVPEGQWLDWEEQKEPVIEAHYGQAWRELHALMDQNPDRDTKQMGELRNLLGLLRPYLTDADAVEHGLHLNAFKAAYAEYWEKVLACDDSAMTVLQDVRGRYPDIPMNSSMALGVANEYLAKIKDAFEEAGFILIDSSNVVELERAANRKQWWLDHLGEAHEWVETPSIDLVEGRAATRTGDSSIERIRMAVSRNEGTYETAVVLNDGAGLSFGIFQWTAKNSLRSKILIPNLDKPWFKVAFGDLYNELKANLALDTAAFVQWSKMGARNGDGKWHNAFVRLGQRPEMQEWERQEADKEIQEVMNGFAEASSGIMFSERAIAWCMDATNQCGSVRWGDIQNVIRMTEAKLQRPLIEQEKILIAAKVQSKLNAAAVWESDVWGREAAYAIDSLPTNSPRSDYTDIGLVVGPQKYVGDTVSLDLDPEMMFGDGEGHLTNRRHPAVRTMFRWNKATKSYDLVSKSEINPNEANDPTRDLKFQWVSWTNGTKIVHTGWPGVTE